MSTALITGASSGLGVDFAKLFAKGGHSLILVARRRELLEDTARALRAQYSDIKVDVIDFDLGVPGAGRGLFDRVKSLGLSVDFLVNNAGFGTAGVFQDLPLSKELQMIDLNVRTLVELSHLFLPDMIRKRSGGILNVASTAAFQPGPYMSTYYASKAFVLSFSEGLYDELRGTGVGCTVLTPGATATEFAQASGMTNSRLFRSGLVAKSSDVALYGYQAMKAGKAIATPGLINRLMVQSLRVSPRFLVRKMAGFFNRAGH